MRNIKTILTLGLIALISNNVLAAACVITGCNNEICGKAGESYFSTCMWKAEYACYNKFGICEADKSGECGWRQSKELVECVNIQLKRVQRGDLSSD
jgi:hypothetical protein